MKLVKYINTTTKAIAHRPEYMEKTLMRYGWIKIKDIKEETILTHDRDEPLSDSNVSGNDFMVEGKPFRSKDFPVTSIDFYINKYNMTPEQVLKFLEGDTRKFAKKKRNQYLKKINAGS